MSRKHHYLNCEVEYYRATETGVKGFELRKNDRGFKVGDMVYLWETIDGKPTGRTIDGREIMYIIRGGKYGLDKDYCILQLERMGQ